MDQQELIETCDICIEIGRLMLSNGAETYRVEDTIYRIGKSMGLVNVNVFAVPTAIIMTVESTNGLNHTELIRVTERNTNLEMVARINNLSRDVVENPVNANELRVKLYRVKLDNNEFKPWINYLAAGFITGAFPLLFGGTFTDILPAFIAGGIGQILFDYLESVTNVSFFAEMTAALVIGLISVFLFRIGFGTNIDAIILGSVMTLVPGVAITNGFRDLMAGHLLAGVSVIAKAILTAAAMGIGIAIVLTLL